MKRARDDRPMKNAENIEIAEIPAESAEKDS